MHPRAHNQNLNSNIKKWAGKDSNLRRLSQQIYSLPPLATWVPARIECLTTSIYRLLCQSEARISIEELAKGLEPPTC